MLTSALHDLIEAIRLVVILSDPVVVGEDIQMLAHRACHFAV